MIREFYFSRRSFVFFLLLFTNQVFAQRTISGKVTEQGVREPLIGVSVRVNDSSTRGTTTDTNGNYAISASDGETLVFSYIGMEAKSVAINGQSSIDVEMST
ncbi:MAG: hypothetical protein ACJAVW_003171, partial [Spirosomataceae bacterium]